MNKKILLIADDEVYSDLIQQALAATKDDTFELQWVRNFPDGIELLSKSEIDVVLLQLSTGEREDLVLVDKLSLVAPCTPTLVLGAPEDEDLARLAVQRGADDYLLKNYVNAYTLPRALGSILERKTVKDALFAERDRAQVTLNSIGDAVLSTDLSGNVTYLNPVAEKMTGWSCQEAIGQRLSEVFHIIEGSTRELARDPLALAVTENRPVGLPGNCVLIRRDGVERSIEDSAAPIHDRMGKVAGAVIVFRDVSESREMKVRMSHLAQHDSLTDLPNRTLLNDRISQAIALAHRHSGKFAVLFLDVDRFKHINDSLGHVVGDKLLRSIAERLLACVRHSDTVSRLGGDEFVILLSEIEHARNAAAIAEKMLVSLATPHKIAPHDIQVTASVGMSVFPNDGGDAETLLKNADIALYQAKEHGRNNSQFFTEDMNVRATERRSLQSGLRNALKNGEFALQYQPKVDLATGAITGAEALLRWHHPIRGLLLPGLFVPFAEEYRLIVPIGQWVLREACRQAQAWRELGLAMHQMAVNISAPEFQAEGFLDGVKAILNDTGFDSRRLELELTESVLMENAESTASLLNELKAMGVKLAVDDFGTGYSSLGYLSSFPIDTLKIDQSFVRKMTTDPCGETIVSTVITMARSLKQRVVAEGVETAEELAFLQARHCDEGQGYHFSRPLDGDAFASMLGTGLPGNMATSVQARAPWKWLMDSMAT